jgi:hypothetical protein
MKAKDGGALEAVLVTDVPSSRSVVMTSGGGNSVSGASVGSVRVGVGKGVALAGGGLADRIGDGGSWKVRMRRGGEVIGKPPTTAHGRRGKGKGNGCKEGGWRKKGSKELTSIIREDV